jgi:hypothetical protein
MRPPASASENRAHSAEKIGPRRIEVSGQRPDGSNVDRVWITYWHPLKDPHPPCHAAPCSPLGTQRAIDRRAVDL